MNENPLATLETVVIIEALIQGVVLIVFLVMAANVAKIRKSIISKNAEDYIADAKMEAYLGNKKAAIDNYMRAKYRYQTIDSVIGANGNDITNQVVEDIDKVIAELQTNTL